MTESAEERSDIALLVKEEGKELGFCRVGIATAEPLHAEGERLRTWLSRSFQAGMGWMDRRKEERVDPGRVLPGARSVVSVAMNYFTPYRHSGGKGRGKVSRYAWGDDYHEILLERLERLARVLHERLPGSRTRAYVDTGPVMEKAWGERGGIGWIGKNGNLITREYGSWVFLGELLTTAALKPDAPATDHCGTCTRCMEACPTRAIVEPGVVDSSLCISYLTIEHRGEFSAREGEMIGEWVYGCDICQDVCPWNTRFARPTGDARFAPREGRVDLDLDAWQSMGEEDYQGMVEGSAMRRAKWGGMKRNIEAVRRNGEG